jgi:hypothetical protein
MNVRGSIVLLFGVMLVLASHTAIAQTDRTCFVLKGDANAQRKFVDGFEALIAKNMCLEAEWGKGDSDRVPKKKTKAIVSCEVNQSSSRKAIEGVFTTAATALYGASAADATAAMTTVTCEAGCVPWNCEDSDSPCWRVRRRCIEAC